MTSADCAGSRSSHREMPSPATIHDAASACLLAATRHTARVPSRVPRCSRARSVGSGGGWSSAPWRPLQPAANPIHGGRPRQRPPKQLSLMHQDIRWMFLVHTISFPFAPRLPASRRRAVRTRSPAPTGTARRGDAARCRAGVERPGSVRGTYPDAGSSIGATGSGQ